MRDYIKKQIIFSYFFIAVGLITGILGLITKDFNGLFIGVTCGFLPTGLGMLFLYKKFGNKADFLQKVKMEQEERNAYINTKSGHKAFWITYYFVLFMFLICQYFGLGINILGISTLIFMGIIYFAINIYYHKTI